SGEEARLMGAGIRLAEPGAALPAAVALAKQLAAFPQRCLRSDRISSYRQWNLDFNDALVEETRLGLEVVGSGDTVAGAQRFAAGAGRHGSFTDWPRELSQRRHGDTESGCMRSHHRPPRLRGHERRRDGRFCPPYA